MRPIPISPVLPPRPAGCPGPAAGTGRRCYAMTRTAVFRIDP
jgi:hypothetical protein